MPLIDTIFAALERLGGQPRELFTFALGADLWRYTSAGRAVTVVATGLTYVPAMIERGRIQRNDESGAVTVAIKLGRGVAVVDRLIESRSTPAALAIHRHQPGDDTSMPILLAYGDIVGLTMQPDGWITANLVTAEASFTLPFPRPVIDRLCQWQTYSPDCGLDEASFSFATTVTARDRTTLTVDSVDSHDDNYYTLGQLLFTDPDDATKRYRFFVASQLGTTLKIIGGLPDSFDDALADGPVDVTLIAGDDKTNFICSQKFDNIDRFLGFRYLPVLDPMKVGNIGLG